jgi:hypothetical protein
VNQINRIISEVKIAKVEKMGMMAYSVTEELSQINLPFILEA